MDAAARSRLVWLAIRVLTILMVTVWLVLIYKIATSSLPMIRQLLGCMFTTMIIFSLLSFALRQLKTYQESLSKEQEKGD